MAIFDYSKYYSEFEGMRRRWRMDMGIDLHSSKLKEFVDLRIGKRMEKKRMQRKREFVLIRIRKRMNMEIDLHCPLMELVLRIKKRMEMKMMQRKREFVLRIRKRMEKKRMERKRRVSQVFKKHYYRYGKAVDGFKYGALLWVREEEDVLHDSNKAFCYEVNVNFLYQLRNGLCIDQRGLSNKKPFVLTGTRFTRSCDYNNIPAGLATIVFGVGIPATYGEAMFKDISRFARKMINRHNDPKKTFTICVQLQVVILQLEGEDVLYTEFRCEAEGYYRGCNANIPIRQGRETGFQPLHIQEYCPSEDVEGEGDCCSICLGKLRGCNSYILPCSHVYHYQCIFKWMWHSNSCPFCRHPYRLIFRPHQIYPSC